MKRYLYYFILAVVLWGVALCVGVYYKKLYRHYFGYYPYLEEYQVGKIESSGDYDTIFLGDSSLGNSIDVAVFDSLLGTHSLNLALTGAYGFYGDLNYLDRVLQIKNINNVVLMHTIDTLSRQPDMRGYLATAGVGAAKELSLYQNILLLKTFAMEMLDFKDAVRGYIMMFFGDSFLKKDNIIVRDYHKQGHPLSKTSTSERFNNSSISNSINVDQAELLCVLARKCKERGLNCVYAFGPVLAQVQRNSLSMIDASSAVVKNSGFALVENTPVPIPFKDIGDSIDHVSPNAKTAFTTAYARLIGPYLRPLSGKLSAKGK